MQTRSSAGEKTGLSQVFSLAVLIVADYSERASIPVAFNPKPASIASADEAFDWKVQMSVGEVVSNTVCGCAVGVVCGAGEIALLRVVGVFALHLLAVQHGRGLCQPAEIVVLAVHLLALGVGHIGHNAFIRIGRRGHHLATGVHSGHSIGIGEEMVISSSC